MAKEESFKYYRDCKLPSCQKPFGTNRDWKLFHHEDCQKEWQKLLRRSHEEVIVDMALLKEDVKKIKKQLGME